MDRGAFSQNIRLNGLATARSAFGVPAGASRGAGGRSWHVGDVTPAATRAATIKHRFEDGSNEFTELRWGFPSQVRTRLPASVFGKTLPVKRLD
jgi:2-methylcitrate dehydratase PrpD